MRNIEQQLPNQEDAPSERDEWEGQQAFWPDTRIVSPRGFTFLPPLYYVPDSAVEDNPHTQQLPERQTDDAGLSDLNTEVRHPYKPPTLRKIPPVIGASGRPDNEENSALSSSEESESGELWVNLEEAVEILGVDRTQIYRIIREGRVRAENREITVVKKKNMLCIPYDDLIKYKESRWKRSESG